MMKQRLLGLFATAFSFGFVACNNSGDNTSASVDTTTDDVNTATTTATSTGSYAAQADSFRINSEAGAYVDARTGKKIRIKVDPETGARTNMETGEPVDYYVDTRTWWVYGDQGFDTIGTAHMEGKNLRFRDHKNKWVPFDDRWKKDDDGDLKMKTEDVKMKVDKDGDMKIKTDDGKVKITEDGVKEKD
ncbi:hypothetical protein OCK74_17635 [Chitinophagaceae bacterium LB-8]|uniref:Lipoprotein n=1 Tax=Paraflavisolibacter caeni TaxID=2982496 RepID=A0A9X2XY89_9BACT|nr:hypothetical protein [Paraflavisolibacter caeni]MCU7550947.1 hypothetical protein [Paraflavisolibacter caeni]